MEENNEKILLLLDEIYSDESLKSLYESKSDVDQSPIDLSIETVTRYKRLTKELALRFILNKYYAGIAFTQTDYELVSNYMEYNNSKLRGEIPIQEKEYGSFDSDERESFFHLLRLKSPK